MFHDKDILSAYLRRCDRIASENDNYAENVNMIKDEDEVEQVTEEFLDDQVFNLIEEMRNVIG